MGIATTRPSEDIANSTSPCSDTTPLNTPVAGMNAAINSRYTGNRAEQLISGEIRIVTMRSRVLSMTRVAMMPGTAHAKLDISGRNDLPLRPSGRHHPVHHVGGLGHVAAVFQDRDEQKQQDDLRQEDQHAADAGNHAVAQQALQGTGRDDRCDPIRGQPLNRFTGVHQRRRPGIERLEHQKHQECKHEQAERAMREEGVDPVGRRARSLWRLRDDVPQQSAGPGVTSVGLERADGMSGGGQSLACRSEKL